MKKILIYFLTLIILISCVSKKKVQELMDSWLGHPKSEIIQSWGPPSRTTSDGKGGEILIWEEFKTTGQFINNQYITNSRTQSKNIYCDSKGIIYSWYAQW